MTHRYALAAVMLAAFALPAAAQQTTPTDTSKKTTTSTSNGAVSDTSKATTTVNPNGAPSNGAQVTATPQPSAAPAATPPAESTNQAAGTPPSTEVAPSSGAMPAMGASKSGASANAPAEGQVTPHAAAKVDVKVAESLASTVKISGDSAFAIARTSPDAGEISSADLEMKEGRLVYEIKMVHGKNGASEVHVDAMTGELIKDKKYGGLKAVDTHAAESQKLQNAKADSLNSPSVKTDSSVTKKP
jgi:uncharacterized membrane protein YkoI